VYLFFTHFIKKQVAFFLAVLFLVHPIQVESVSYIAQTVVPLGFCFGMGAVLLSMAKKISRKKIVVYHDFTFGGALDKRNKYSFSWNNFTLYNPFQ
jgi:hypothetical protein